jgi:hypothetical protein
MYAGFRASVVRDILADAMLVRDPDRRGLEQPPFVGFRQ